MTTAAPEVEAQLRQQQAQKPADVFVVFGITGDLAKVMTFRFALPARAARPARLPDRRRRRRRLDGRPAQGSRARVDRRAPARRSTRRSSIASPTGSRTSPATSATTRPTSASPRRSTERRRPSSTSRSRRSSSAGSSRASPRPGLTKTGRVVVEKPFGHDRASARELADGAPPVHRRVAALPDRPLPREDGPRGDPLPAVRELDARAALEPELPRVRPDHDGRGLRRRGPRPLLRPGRRAARRRRQPPDASRRRRGDGDPVRGASRT